MELKEYAARTGYTGGFAPTVETLHAIHLAHATQIPFENLDVLRRIPIRLDVESLWAKLVTGRRGGYCFEQNSLFARVLTALGFQVEGLAARVRWNMAPDAPAQPRTHMVNRVEIDGVSWLADVGFGGCVLTAPLRMDTPEAQDTDHDRYRLTPILGGFTQEVEREQGWVPAYDLSLTPCVPRDYEMANWFTSTHPTSLFTGNLLVQRLTPECRCSLFNTRLTERHRDGGVGERVLADAEDLADVLRATFAIAPPVDAAEIWSRLPGN